MAFIPIKYRFIAETTFLVTSLLLFYCLIWREKKKYKAAVIRLIQFYELSMFLLAASSGATWYLVNYHDDYSVQMQPANQMVMLIPYCIFFFMLFKIKQIQIMLNIEQNETNVVVQKLARYARRARLFYLFMVI